LGTTRSKTITNGYIAIFVCFATKAVNIELVTSLTTEAFLVALGRFIAHREKPRTIYSDNGTNFQGAAKQLHEIYSMLQSTSEKTNVQEFLANEGCVWRFIPPHGPHHGGIWEAAVKSMKYHLRRILGAHIATYKELSTLLAEIEACLNSRPLCTLSDDPFNQTYLSPRHFLIGQPLTQLPSIDYTNIKCNSLSRWQLFQQMQQHLAEMVGRLPSRSAAVPTMAEDIPQPTNWRCRPGKVRPHLTTPLAYISHHRYPSWQGQQDLGGYY
jgi:hypothetical protein